MTLGLEAARLGAGTSIIEKTIVISPRILKFEVAVNFRAIR